MRTQRFELEQNQTIPQAQNNQGQYHVCGIIVNVAIDKLLSAKTLLTQMDGCEIHHETDKGQLVVTVEDHENILSYEQIKNIQNIEGVLSVDLVSHHFDDVNV